MHAGDPNNEVEYRSYSLISVGDRLQHSLKTIFPILDAGNVVLCDRYFFSSVANLRARGYTGDRWIYEIGKLLPEPDLAIFCEPPLDVVQARLAERKENRFDDPVLRRNLYRQLQLLRGQFRNSFAIDTSTPPDETLDRLGKTTAA